MRRILNESARMKKIAGIISEGNYEEGKNDHAKKLEKIALKVYAKIENSVEVEDDMLQMSKREIAEFVPKGAPVKAIVDLVHSYMRGNMPLPDDFDEMEEGADMAKSDEITMEGDEVNEYSAAKSLGSSAKLNTFADMIAYFGTDYDGDFVDVSGKPRYPKAAQDFYRANIAKYRDWLDNFESDPMYKLHLMVKKAAGEYGGFN